jgi:5-bromo-4-chloroindolyl phosphate hydrolysis protein
MIRNTPAGVPGDIVAGRPGRPRLRLRRMSGGRGARARAATGLVRRGRAWAPTAKAAALVVLPLPLAVASIAALVDADIGQATLTLTALACLWGAGACAFQGLAAEARYLLDERPTLPRVPLKLASAALTALGVALAAMAGGYPAAGILLFVLLAITGHLAFYGRDLRPRRVRVAAAEGIDLAQVEQLLGQAYGRLRRLEIAAASIDAPAFRRRLTGVVGTGRAILEELERRPAEASRARRFLNVYLDGAERVTAQYARAVAAAPGATPDQEYDALLTDIERTFEAQHRRLVERDRLALDVDIEVLSARLRQEALADGDHRP